VVNGSDPTMEPVTLVQRSIENANQPGQLVVVAFLGSGTAIIAAEPTGRHCHGVDRGARYCDVVLKGWEEFAGQAAAKVGA